MNFAQTLSKLPLSCYLAFTPLLNAFELLLALRRQHAMISRLHCIVPCNDLAAGR